jgi:hypothetical protein
LSVMLFRYTRKTYRSECAKPGNESANLRNRKV